MEFPICEKYPTLPRPDRNRVIRGLDLILRCKKYPFQPSEDQAKMLKKWIKLTEIAYNLAVNRLRKVRTNLSMVDLRKIVRSEFDAKYSRKVTKSRLPIDMLDEAIRDAHKARHSAMALVAAGHVKRFRLRHKKHSSPKKCLSLTNKCFSIAGFIYEKSLKLEVPDLNFMQYNSRLIRHHDKWWISVPKSRGKIKVMTKRPYCGLDPGIRTFLTGYDGKGVFELHNDKIAKKRRQIQNIEKKIVPRKKSKINRIKRKITRIVDQLHWQSAAWLAKSYEKIYLGDMSTQRIISNDRHLPKSSKRDVTFLRLYQFRLRLQAKAEEYESELIPVDESYTTQTCGQCQERTSPGKSKIFKCGSCGFEWGRDYNAARNILIRGSAG